MELQIQKIEHIDDHHAKRMFSWESDPFICGPCKGPDDRPSWSNWQDLKSKLNASADRHRFGIYHEKELVGEFNFVFNHRELLKTQPKTAWIAIGIGDPRCRGKGAGSIAMATMEREILALGGKRIELGVFEFNEPAIKFYEKLGYKRFAEIPQVTWWEGKWWADYRYEKFLVQN